VPIYEYVCGACAQLTEVMQRVSDPAPACPACGEAKLARIMSRTSFQLKGGGWYSDLYSTPNKKGEGGAAEPAASEPGRAASEPGRAAPGAAGGAAPSGATAPAPAAATPKDSGAKPKESGKPKEPGAQPKDSGKPKDSGTKAKDAAGSKGSGSGSGSAT
jgi:putative FmdB family regulatory protein